LFIWASVSGGIVLPWCPVKAVFYIVVLCFMHCLRCRINWDWENFALIGKGYSAVQMMRKFPARNWSRSRLRFAILLSASTRRATLMGTRRPASADRIARRQLQATGQPVSRPQASDAMTSRLPCYEAKCVQCRCFECWSVPLRSDIKGTELPHANILIPLERQLIALQLCRWQFLYNEPLQQTCRPLLSKLSKRRQI